MTIACFSRVSLEQYIDIKCHMVFHRIRVITHTYFVHVGIGSRRLED